MANLKQGDRVRVISRTVTDEDRKTNRYFEHMSGLIGTVQNIYDNGEVGVEVDVTSLGGVSEAVHSMATQRMRDKFNDNVTEEQRKALTKEEMEFTPHYVLLLSAKDVEIA
jgi:hypothetical protein